MRKGEFKLRQQERSGLSNLSKEQQRQVKNLMGSGEFSKKAIKSVFGLTYEDLKTISKCLYS
ncbi:hypothetical protein DMW20_11935 [Vibrio parahaemolyticus]|nr:hypothetical protein [Vibrio parahaemolyticus]